MNFSKHLCHPFGAILLFALTILAHSSVNDADLQKQYGGQVLTLRQFYPGEHLHFNAVGKLASAGTPGPWTVDGQVQVANISLKDGVVHIRGRRLVLFFDPENKQLRDVGSVTKTDNTRKLFRKKVDGWAAKQGKTEIEVECGVAQPEMADLTKAMNAVFLAPGEALAGVVPYFWKRYLEPKASGSPPPLPEGAAMVHRVGGAVSAPRETYAPNPSYTELARQAGYQAGALLWLIVDRDGSTRSIMIVRPAGMGLDESAVDAVRTWRFDPAKRDGKEVSVQVNIEVNFHLY